MNSVILIQRVVVFVLLSAIAFASGCQNSEVRVPKVDVSNIDIPERPTFEVLENTQFGMANYVGDGPANGTRMKVYLPGGEHGAASLGCVFIAPAGTNLLTGSTISSDYHDESLPYAKAGFAVVQYSLDGPLPENPSDLAFSSAYKKFKASSGGMDNLKRAIEFVKTRFPEVDPARLYAAGHSSAGTISLMAAVNFPEIKAVIAFAPCSDPEDFHAEFKGASGVEKLLPGYAEFDRKSSPLRNANKIKCPVFLFQADDDQVTTAAETAKFSAKLKLENDQVSIVEVPRGGHYNSMIREGIPAAIKWLRSRD